MKRVGHRGFRPYNWLVHRIVEETLVSTLRKYARGVLVDIGCGEKPYAALTQGLVTAHIGVDHPGTLHNPSSIDVFATAYDTTLEDSCADTVLSTFVLEHLEEPERAVREMFRILRPGGHVILLAPLFWHLHEEPRDFFRYTKYGLAALFERAGFEVVEAQPLSGFIVTAAQELCYFLDRFDYPVLHYPVRGVQFLLQWCAYRLHKAGFDTAHAFTWSNLAVARKPA